jgi:hypothetical protein
MVLQLEHFGKERGNSLKVLECAPGEGRRRSVGVKIEGVFHRVKVKVKLSRHRPGQALGVLGG